MSADKMNRKRKQDEAEVVEPTTTDEKVVAQILNGTLPKERPKKKPKPEERRSIFVRSMPSDVTNQSLTAFFSEYFPVKHATLICDKKTKESKGYGFVTFTDAEDAHQAKVALDKKEWDGRRIRIEIAEPRQRNMPVGQKPARPEGKPLTKEELAKVSTKLIVRNLPWSIKSSADLSKLFRPFGIVRYADLPSNHGKMKGFGFVTIRGKKNAEKALEAINGKEIDGRTLAVDWAVDKTTWDNAQEQEKDTATTDQDDEAANGDQDDNEDDDKEVEKNAGPEDTLNADMENFFRNHMVNMEDEDDEDDEEEDDDIEDGEEDEDADYGDEIKDQKTFSKSRTDDNDSTVFIRNLPFNATDEQLKGFFAQHGKVRYARVVIDKATEKSAGTGFVCFFSSADAKACILGCPRTQQQDANNAARGKQSILQDESADPDGKYTLDGRLLSVAQAVNREQAAHLADSSSQKRREKDKRRLFLLSEGQVGPSSPLYKLLSQSELQMRQTSAAQRKKQVEKNPSLHLSLTRLALRNIPRSLGSKELKELARKAIVGFAKDVKEGRRQPLSKEENARDGPDAKEKEQERRHKGKGIVRQAKIVFESTTGSKVDEKSGAGKSRGYGFIEYTSHHWALMGLRYLNGLQLEGDGGRKQRLICEFSIENAQVVQRRRATESNSNQAPKAKRTAEKAAAEEKNKRTQKTLRDNKEARGKGVRGKKGNQSSGGKAAKEDAASSSGGMEEKDKGGEFGMKQRLIARTRLVRKKKMATRGRT